jgi:hypothetical protein
MAIKSTSWIPKEPSAFFGAPSISNRRDPKFRQTELRSSRLGENSLPLVTHFRRQTISRWAGQPARGHYTDYRPSVGPTQSPVTGGCITGVTWHGKRAFIKANFKKKWGAIFFAPHMRKGCYFWVTSLKRSLKINQTASQTAHNSGSSVTRPVGTSGSARYQR